MILDCTRIPKQYRSQEKYLLKSQRKKEIFCVYYTSCHSIDISAFICGCTQVDPTRACGHTEGLHCHNIYIVSQNLNMLCTLDIPLLFVPQLFHSKCPVLSNANDNRQRAFGRCHQLGHCCSSGKGCWSEQAALLRREGKTSKQVLSPKPH